jgi:hypothetical protein
MSKPNRARFRLAELRTKRAAEHGDSIEIETDDGQMFTVPAPGFWGDDVKEHLAANRDVAAVKALLGPADYLRFREAGGRADDVMLALAAYSEAQGLTVGESSASPA